MDAPWSTKGAIILDADHQTATEWSSYVKPIIKYHKASSLLTAAPTDDQDNLVAQLTLFRKSSTTPFIPSLSTMIQNQPGKQFKP
jgi:hypothetical protein